MRGPLRAAHVPTGWNLRSRRRIPAALRGAGIPGIQAGLVRLKLWVAPRRTSQDIAAPDAGAISSRPVHERAGRVTSEQVAYERPRGAEHAGDASVLRRPRMAVLAHRATPTGRALTCSHRWHRVGRRPLDAQAHTPGCFRSKRRGQLAAPGTRSFALPGHGVETGGSATVEQTSASLPSRQPRRPRALRSRWRHAKRSGTAGRPSPATLEWSAPTEGIDEAAAWFAELTSLSGGRCHLQASPAATPSLIAAGGRRPAKTWRRPRVSIGRRPLAGTIPVIGRSSETGVHRCRIALERRGELAARPSALTRPRLPRWRWPTGQRNQEPSEAQRATALRR